MLSSSMGKNTLFSTKKTQRGTKDKKLDVDKGAKTLKKHRFAWCLSAFVALNEKKSKKNI